MILRVHRGIGWSSSTFTIVRPACMLGKIFSRRHFEIFHFFSLSLFFHKTDFGISCKLSSLSFHRDICVYHSLLLLLLLLLLLFCIAILICNNGLIQIQSWKSPFQKLRNEWINRFISGRLLPQLFGPVC